MGQLLRRFATFLGLISPIAYSYPALDITLPGERNFHLVGSIHMGTMDMTPLPGQLLERLARADSLIVEADITDAVSPFAAYQPQPPISERLTPVLYERLQQLCRESGTDEAQLSALPAWQIALLLQARQAQRLGLRPDYGIDYQLLQAAKQQQKTIIELEGPLQQLALLQQLPQDGMPLLEDTLAHWHTNARLLQTMISWWLESPPGEPQTPLPSTFSAELYQLLMHQRNRLWRDALMALPTGSYVIAVGALHLYGEGNLPDLLLQRP